MRTPKSAALAFGLAFVFLAGLAGARATQDTARAKVSERPEAVTPSSKTQAQQKKKGQAKAKAEARKNRREARKGDDSESKAGSGSSALAFPTGDRGSSVLLVETETPAEVRVGHEFTYTVKVTNLTDNVVLEDVRLTQQTPDALEIERSEPSQGQEGAGGSGGAQWNFARLKPGESKTIKVTAIAGSEGQAESCFRVRYNPALCVASSFIKPEVSLTKTAPETADICNPITLQYTIKNQGSASAKGLTIEDELPEGLKTADGKSRVSFDVGELPEGESKQFKVEARAAKTGKFASRAVATGDDDIQVQSKKPTTQVRQAVLAVNLEGPDATYINEPSTYTVTVKNEGDAPAEETTLEVQLADNAKLVEARAADDNGGDAETSQDESQLTWTLGTLKPGATRTFKITATGQSKGQLKHTATATSACARGQDNKQLAQAATARAETATRILTLPALLLSAVDQDDPIQVGQTETYYITIVNQGTGADENVQIKAKLPENYEFVGVDGPTDAKADGQTITFDPIETLEAGDRVRWKLQAKAKETGDIQLRVELTSDYLSQPAISTEPTRLIK